MSKPKVEHKTVVKKPDTVVQSKEKPTEQPEPTKKNDEPQPGGQEGGVVGGVQGGVVGGVVGGVLGGVVGGQLGGTGAIPFGEGMTRPTPISQPAPLYTREAAAARITGKVILKCVITVDGSLKDCKIIKGLPFMDQAVLDALHKWKYTPVTFQGRPVSVYYPINLTVVPP